MKSHSSEPLGKMSTGHPCPHLLAKVDRHRGVLEQEVREQRPASQVFFQGKGHSKVSAILAEGDGGLLCLKVLREWWR